MRKNLFKIVSTLVIMTSLFCGCGAANKKSVDTATSKTTTSQQEKASEYGEADKPWGDNNYKKAGVIKNLTKNYDDNYTTATFTADGEKTNDKIKIYGTDIKTSDYEGKKAFISAVKDDNASKDYVLVKRYNDINLLNTSLMSSISTLSSIDNNDELNKVKTNIDSIKDADYKDYVISVYNTKINTLTEKKAKEEEQRKAAEEQAAKQRQEEEAKRQQQEAQAAQAKQNSTSNNTKSNGATVYIASSGKGEKYHSNPDCSRMKGNVDSLSRSEAVNAGYGPCKKCYR